MKIAICDDESVQRAYVRRLVEKLAPDAQVQEFESGESLLFNWPVGFDAAILDIQMGGMDGVTLARRIRETDRRAQLVFLTAFPDYMQAGYEVEAVHYLMKPVSEEKLNWCLERIRERLCAPQPALLIQTEQGPVRLLCREILFLESEGHYVRFRTTAGEYRARMSLQEAEPQLGAGFYKSHRSTLINLRFVRRIAREGVYMTDGSMAPLARRLYDAANRAFIEFEE